MAIRAVYSYWLLVYWTKQIRGLTAMRNRDTLLRAEQSRAEQSRAEQSRAEQSRAEQSRAEQANCALFASCEALETEYYIRDG